MRELDCIEDREEHATRRVEILNELFIRSVTPASERSRSRGERESAPQ